MVEKGILVPGTTLFTRSRGQIYKATLNENRSIGLETKNDYVEHRSPTSTAKVIRKNSVNGWIFWKILESGKYRDLKSDRDRYIQSQGFRETVTITNFHWLLTIAKINNAKSI